MAEFPALPLWTDAYLGDTSHLTTMEHGAYLLLLIVSWRTKETRLPDDDKLLARYVRCTAGQWAKLRPILEPFFKVEGGFWIQGRLNDEAKAVRSKKATAAANGRASALKRQGRHSTEREQSESKASTEIQLNHNHYQEEKKEVTATSAAPLAFSGQVIRLNHHDFRQWQTAFPDLDLRAVLQSRDDWMITEGTEQLRKKWFIATSNHLANLQQKARAESRRVEQEQDMPV